MSRPCRHITKHGSFHILRPPPSFQEHPSQHLHELLELLEDLGGIGSVRMVRHIQGRNNQFQQVMTAIPRWVQAMRAYKNAGPASGPQGPLDQCREDTPKASWLRRVISDGMLRIWLNKGKRAVSAHVSVEALFLRCSNTLTDGLTVTRLLFHALSRTSDVSIADMSAVDAATRVSNACVPPGRRGIGCAARLKALGEELIDQIWPSLSHFVRANIETPLFGLS